jgi:hypothetical protein
MRGLVCLALWLLSSSTAHAEWPDLSIADQLIMDIDGTKDAALIVGVEQYSNLPRIDGARMNAELWFQFLRTSLGIPGRNLVLLKNGDAKDYKIRATLTDLVKHAKSGGRVWFVFVGHGAPSRKPGDGLLAGYDASGTAEGMEERSLHRSELLQILGARARDNVTGVAILDACFSGQTHQGALVQGLMPVAIVNKAVPSRVIVMTAAGSDEFAGPLPQTHPARPAFSYLMLGAMRGWADTNKDGRVTAREAVAYSDDTLQATLRGDRQQHPTLDGGDEQFVLSDGNEPPPEFPEYSDVNELDPDASRTPIRTFAGKWPDTPRERDSGESPPVAAADDDDSLVHGIGSIEVGIGGGAPFSTFVLLGQAGGGVRIGDYIRLSGYVSGAASDFQDTDAGSANPSPRPRFGASGLAGLGLLLARTRALSVSADALGGVTYIGERCDNPVSDGAGNLICDRVLQSGLGAAGGVRLAMQLRVGKSEAVLGQAAGAQGLLISGTALTSKLTGWFGGVFVGYGAW